MRNYALTCATMNEQIGNWPMKLLRNWWKRRILKRLNAKALFARQLSEEDRDWLLALPLDIDPDAALEDRAFRRAHLRMIMRKPASRPDPEKLPAPRRKASPRKIRGSVPRKPKSKPATSPRFAAVRTKKGMAS